MNDETLTNPGDKPLPRSADSDSLGAVSQTLKTATRIQPDVDLAGKTLGNYRLTRKIAEGGMGVVYEAIQTQLDRKVALKVLTEDLSGRSEFLKRFEREAKAAAALSHPNLVQVYDFGVIEGRYYLVMEFIEGEDLAQHVQRYGKVPVDQALDMVEQAAQALKAACAKSIIHRDIKPSNLMLTRDGCVKVSDLGLAKILTETTDVTATGVGMGSPHFIAPEQADDSRRVDHRVDIYALGITLLFLVTGRKPYEGTSPFSVVLAHASKPLPTGEELGTSLPLELETLIGWMAEKHPDDRYQNYQSLIDDIQRVRAGEMPVREISPSVAAAPAPSTGIRGMSRGTPSTGRAMPASRVSEPVTRSKSPVVMAMIVGLAIASIGFGVFALLHSRKPANGPAAVTAPSVPATEQRTEIQAEPRTLPNNNRGPGRGFEEGPGGPPDGAPQLLPVLPEINNPLAEGPVEKMFEAAEDYAKKNPTNYRNMLARYEQVEAKAVGSDLEAKVKQAADDVFARKRAAAEKAMREYKVKFDELLAARGHREAVGYLRTFPEELRSAEIDRRILEEISVPPPGEEALPGARGGRSGPPRARP
jgi:serine/threonine protein kinase